MLMPKISSWTLAAWSIEQWPALDHRRAIRSDFQPFSASPRNISLKKWPSKPSKYPKLEASTHDLHILSDIWLDLSRTQTSSHNVPISHGSTWVDLAHLLLTGSGRCWCFLGALAEPPRQQKKNHGNPLTILSKHTQTRKGMFLWSCTYCETQVMIEEKHIPQIHVLRINVIWTQQN